jgi:hypothetical protein
LHVSNGKPFCFSENPLRKKISFFRAASPAEAADGIGLNKTM